MKLLKHLRRTNSFTLALLCLLLPFSQGLAAAAELSEGAEGAFYGRYSKAIELQNAGQYQAFFLDPEVYEGANESLSDLRIINGKGLPVPYYIESGYGTSVDQQRVYSSTLVGTAKKDNHTILDYRITPLQQNMDIIGNVLKLELPRESFLKHVELYGGYDGNQWELVKKDQLYRADQLEKSTIELASERKFSYYRLIVLNNMEELAFSKLQLLHNSREAQWNDYKQNASPAYEVKQNGKQTVITVENPNRLRIKKLRLDSAGSFTRSYTLSDPSGRQIPVEGNRELYQLDFKNTRITNTTMTSAEVMSMPTLTVTIHNQDNPPLAINGISIEFGVDKVVFEDQGSGPYRLYYGDPNAVMPQYDLIRFKPYIQKELIPLGKLGEKHASPEPPKPAGKPWWFQTKTWFNVVIIAVSLVLVFILGRKLNQTGR